MAEPRDISYRDRSGILWDEGQGQEVAWTKKQEAYGEFIAPPFDTYILNGQEAVSADQTKTFRLERDGSISVYDMATGERRFPPKEAVPTGENLEGLQLLFAEEMKLAGTSAQRGDFEKFVGALAAPEPSAETIKWHAKQQEIDLEDPKVKALLTTPTGATEQLGEKFKGQAKEYIAPWSDQLRIGINAQGKVYWREPGGQPVFADEESKTQSYLQGELLSAAASAEQREAERLLPPVEREREERRRIDAPAGSEEGFDPSEIKALGTPIPQAPAEATSAEAPAEAAGPKFYREEGATYTYRVNADKSIDVVHDDGKETRATGQYLAPIQKVIDSGEATARASAGADGAILLAEEAAPKEAAPAKEAPAKEAAAAAAEAAPGDRKALARGLRKETYARGQKADIRRSLGPMALVGGMSSAIQLLSAFRPDLVGDAQDKYVAEQMKSMEAKGFTGLSPDQQRMMEQQMLAPGRALATETRQRREAQEAASGQRQSAAALERARQGEQEQMGQLAQRAGMAISQANLDAASQELQRYEQMKAYQGERQRQKLGAVAETAKDIGYMAGQMRAGKAARITDPTTLVKALPPDMSDAEAREIVGKVEKASKYGKKMGADRFDEIMKEHGLSPEEIGVEKYDSLTDLYTSDNLGSFRRKQTERRVGSAEALYEREKDAPWWSK